ncbi:hypothetical protein Dsin_018316 [Dipteronia sinensis]|uniref:Zinc finger BED domain-containing protein RICESLEEPER 2-like n=1 Tax=Dipteronia sinensis TaxID=43782 RepID=A0AAE0A540_9ROSI|nr:hypothetical protein Dsin_018316 [Dipteronia sinensis]
MLDDESEDLDKGGNNSSWAWDHFIQLSSDPKKPKSKCQHCGLKAKTISYATKRNDDDGKLIATSYNEEKCIEALARLQKFKSCAEKEKISSNKLLCLDVPTRWNSTYLMLDSAEKFQKAFERIFICDFDTFMRHLCMVHSQLKNWCDSKDIFMKHMVENMKKKYDK